MRLKWLLFFLFVLCGTSYAQTGVRFTSQVTEQGTIATVTTAVVLPQNPIINFCSAPANGVPCTNLATTYTDDTLGTACPSATQIVLDGTNRCVSTPDAQNNWGVWVAAGQYTYTISYDGMNFGPYFVTAGGASVGTPFGSITSGTNTSAAMVVGSGSSLGVTGGTLTTSNLNKILYVDGVNYTTVQAAMTAANALGGGTVLIPDGTYVGPTTWYSNVWLAAEHPSRPEICPNGINGFNCLTPSTLNTSRVTLTYSSSLTLTDLVDIGIVGLTMDFGTNGTGNLTLAGIKYSTFNFSILHASQAAPGVSWVSSASNNTALNQIPYIGISGGDEGMLFEAPSGKGVTLNDFGLVELAQTNYAAGIKYVGVDFNANCDTNWFQSIQMYTTSTSLSNGIYGIVFNDNTTTDEDANGEIIHLFAQTGAPITNGVGLIFNPSTGNYIVTGVLSWDEPFSVATGGPANSPTFTWLQQSAGAGNESSITSQGFNAFASANSGSSGAPFLELQRGTFLWTVYDDSINDLQINSSSTTNNVVTINPGAPSASLTVGGAGQVGTGGPLIIPEQTAVKCTNVAGTALDVICGNSSTHWPAFDPNNSGTFSLCGTSGSLTSGDQVLVNASGTACNLVDGGSPGSGGTVTSFSAGNLSPLFTSSVASATTTPALTFSQSTFAAHKWYGNPSASTGNPIVSLIGASDVSPNAYASGGGTANAQTVTLTPAVTAWTAGLSFCWLPSNANTTTTPTINPNSLGAKTITKYGQNALVANDLVTTSVACVIYDGTDAELQNPNTSVAAGLSGMTATQVPIAATATTITSSDPLQGTDSSILTSGTISSSTGISLCTDSNHGATTTGCSSSFTPQVNGTNLSTTTGINLENNAVAAGINFSNPATTGVQAVLANPTGTGNAVDEISLTGVRAGDYVTFPTSTTEANTTPGIAVNAQTGTTYTVVTGDRGKLLTFTNASSVAVTLPQANSTGFDTNFYFCAKNIGTTPVTITPTTSTIQAFGAALSALTLYEAMGACIYSDNTNYFANVTGPQVVGVLYQTGVSTANSGSAQTVATVPSAGLYRLNGYFDQSAGCTTVGSGALTDTMGWTDATHARSDGPYTFTPATADTGTGLYGQVLETVHAAASSTITITFTYTACTTGTWTYDTHFAVEKLN